MLAVRLQTHITHKHMFQADGTHRHQGYNKPSWTKQLIIRHSSWISCETYVEYLYKKLFCLYMYKICLFTEPVLYLHPRTLIQNLFCIYTEYDLNTKSILYLQCRLPLYKICHMSTLLMISIFVQNQICMYNIGYVYTKSILYIHCRLSLCSFVN